jgi:hypothetical protein
MPNKILVNFFKFQKSSVLFNSAYKNFIEVAYLNGHENKELKELAVNLHRVEKEISEATFKYLDILRKIGIRKGEEKNFTKTIDKKD